MGVGDESETPLFLVSSYEVVKARFKEGDLPPVELVDPRLIDAVPRAVSKAAIATGVARKFPKDTKKLKEA